MVRGPSDVTTSEFADTIAERLRTALAPADFKWRVLGAAPAPIAKLRGHHRYQIQLQAADGAALRTIVRQVTAELKPPEDVLWIADVDPLDML